MNPGKCLPKSKSSIARYNVVNSLTDKLINNKKVPADPDPAQCHVMRVMENLNLEHVLLLNLSDLRCTENFKEILKKYKNLDFHSIFSPQRLTEIKSIFKSNTILPVVCAWGTGKYLKQISTQCINVLTSHGIVPFGIRKGNSNYFYYPTPRIDKGNEKKLSWLNQITYQLTNNKCVR